MKKKFHIALLSVSALGAVWLTPQAGASSVTIYSDPFTGSATALNGANPVVESGLDGGSASATWNADSAYLHNGTVSNSGGSAVLPFTPQSGFIYNLSVNLNPTSGNNWFAVGFEPSAPANGVGDFNTNNGSGWLLIQPIRGTGDGALFLGPANSNSVPFDTASGNVLFNEQLNTSAATWTVQYFQNGVAIDATPYSFSSNPTINDVGLAQYQAAGTVGNFALTATPAPEASAWLSMVGGLGMLMSFRRFGRKRTA